MTPPKKQKLFTISLRCGRLANRLIIFANFVALAEEQGHCLINFTFHSYSELFEGTRENVYCRYPRPKRRSWMDVVPGVAAFLRKTRIPYHLTRYTARLNERHPVFGDKVVTLHEFPGPDYTLLEGLEYQAKIRPAKIVFVYGWWLRTPALMKKHGEKIRAYFRPVEKFVTAATAAVDPLRRQADILIGIHVRHGDYSYWKGGQYFFPPERYAAWMRDLVAQFPGRKVAFLVCSDEPRRVDEFPGLVVGLGTDSPVSDVFALSQCDYILGPKSTFTQWASFYGDKPLLHLEGRDHVVKLEDFRVCYLEWGS
jgi:Glycosyl transferase family 11